MAKKQSSKSRNLPIYPRDDVPFIFFDETNRVSTNKTSARFYLLRNQPCLDEDVEDTRPDIVAELGMGLHTFGLMTLEFYAVLKSMMHRGAIDPEMTKSFLEIIEEIEAEDRVAAVKKSKPEHE